MSQFLDETRNILLVDLPVHLLYGRSPLVGSLSGAILLAQFEANARLRSSAREKKVRRSSDSRVYGEDVCERDPDSTRSPVPVAGAAGPMPFVWPFYTRWLPMSRGWNSLKPMKHVRTIRSCPRKSASATVQASRHSLHHRRKKIRSFSLVSRAQGPES